MKVNVKLANPECLPTKPHSTDAGFDLVANSIIKIYDDSNMCTEPDFDTFNTYTIQPYHRVLVGTGIKIELPTGYYSEIVSRSGLSLKNGVFVINSPGIIDPDYRGEICIILMNLTKVPYELKRFSRVAQMVIHKIDKFNIAVSDSITTTIRGANGFGSSGVK